MPRRRPALLAHVQVAHVQAGLHSGVMAVAEELNRRLIDFFATLLCAPGDRAVETLLDERPMDKARYIAVLRVGPGSRI